MELKESQCASLDSLSASVKIFEQKRRSFQRIPCVWTGRKLLFKGGEFYFCESLYIKCITNEQLRLNITILYMLLHGLKRYLM